jgi:hypothetical protein
MLCLLMAGWSSQLAQEQQQLCALVMALLALLLVPLLVLVLVLLLALLLLVTCCRVQLLVQSQCWSSTD